MSGIQPFTPGTSGTFTAGASSTNRLAFAGVGKTYVGLSSALYRIKT